MGQGSIVIGGKKVIAIIPARGGSKGLPGKNIVRVGGKPLLVWTIEAARRARHIDRLILSSDDEAIIAVGREFGCDVPFKRDARLAADDSPTMDVVLDALQRCPGYDWVVLLQPTSPLRSAEDIDGILERCTAAKAPACVSVCEAEQSPYWMYTLAVGGRLAPLLPSTATRRQDLPRVYVLNGAAYVADIAWLASTRSFLTPETVAYEMPIERSLVIDTEADLATAQTYLRAST
jgi:CMP-N,N'-diacetyllegionaminic acid synthase